MNIRFDLCKFTHRVYYPVILIIILNVKCNEAIFTILPSHYLFRTLIVRCKEKEPQVSMIFDDKENLHIRVSCVYISNNGNKETEQENSIVSRKTN